MTERLQIIPIEEIYPNPYQPRTEFSEQELKELSQSIRENGLIQPIIVRKSEIIGYELIAGERRLRACKRLGLKDISAVIKDISDKDSKKQAIIENLQRSNLNPIEEAKAYEKLIQQEGYSHEELAFIIGKSRPYISNVLRLLQLPSNIQDSLENSVISQGHARALLSITNPKKQLSVFEKVITENWSVRQLENFLREQPPTQNKNKKDIFVEDQEKKLEKLLGLPVTIRYKKNHTGSLQIYFSNEEDFNRIINKLE
ncbi:ParB/RepB/Spo0J family partition protein [Streptococcus dentiloxodontae]